MHKISALKNISVSFECAVKFIAQIIFLGRKIYWYSHENLSVFKPVCLIHTCKYIHAIYGE